MALAGCAPTPRQEVVEEDKKAAANGPDSTTVTAIGSGMGKHGNFDVEVSVTDGDIDRITVLDSRETPGLGDVAMEKMTQAIIDGQTLNVDTVTGATLSSLAFLNAVSSALDAAGQEAAEWKERAYQAWETDVAIPTSADVVVVGAGGAGFAAAITAANEGKSVVLLDKMGVYGGDTALSGGEMAVPGNWDPGDPGRAGQPGEPGAGHAGGRRQQGRPGAGDHHRQRRAGFGQLADLRGRRVVEARPHAVRRPQDQALHHPDHPLRIGDDHEADQPRRGD